MDDGGDKVRQLCTVMSNRSIIGIKGKKVLLSIMYTVSVAQASYRFPNKYDFYMNCKIANV